MPAEANIHCPPTWREADLSKGGPYKPLLLLGEGWNKVGTLAQLSPKSKEDHDFVNQPSKKGNCSCEQLPPFAAGLLTVNC